ncbi:MAG: outer membrane protein assembly factor BamD [Deltaproteobacteria bacterium]|nr:outer membrane protein assembly factor BamD [Deltaproteobacteria bacterium]
MRRIILLFFISVFICSGCALFSSPKKEKSAQELADIGTKEFSKGNYSYAIKHFENLKDWYPFSNLAILAEMKIADSHYKLKDYEEAVLAYEQFESLHPRNEKIPYVLYQIARCYYDRVGTIDRDQTPARNALHAFNRLLKQFPETSYLGQSKVYIAKCLQSLAENEFYVGYFYFKSKQYKAALYRFKAVISDYPDVGVNWRALQYIVLCEKNIKEKKNKTL